MLSVNTIILVLSVYFGLLVTISLLTSTSSDSDTFFTGDRNSPWYIVAFGMIGASLSGVTFISITGMVEKNQFSYMQMVLGYIPGYFVIAYVLVPLYYKLNLVSIYKVLEQKFGTIGFKLGATFFLISRTIGSSFRLYLVAFVLQEILFDRLGLPFPITVFVSISLIFLYTQKGGIKTVVWTDTLQTAFMLIAVVLTIYAIKEELNYDWTRIFQTVSDSTMSKTFFFEDPNSEFFFWKQFLSGALIAIVMTGLDQDMMQKNLTCKNTKESQKNLVTMSLILVPVNILFLGLGILLFHYANANGIIAPTNGDSIFTFLAMNHLPEYVSVIFILGITAAAYSSADSALTSLTTSFCFDFLNFKERENKEKKRLKNFVHIGFSIVLFMVIMIFRYLINDQSVVRAVFTAATYTYGPLLGLFILSFIVKQPIKNSIYLYGFIGICIASPILSYVLNMNSKEWFDGFEFGYLLLLINGLITAIGCGIFYILAINKQSKITIK